MKIMMLFLEDKENTNICTTFCLGLTSKSK